MGFFKSKEGKKFLPNKRRQFNKKVNRDSKIENYYSNTGSMSQMQEIKIVP